MDASVSQAISALRQALPRGYFALESTPEYDAVNLSYLSGLESDLRPACVFLPWTKLEVMAFVKTIRQFAGSVQFAVRGGGQQPLPGCANIEGGITIDLRLLSGVEIQDSYVKIGAGERWGTVYEKLEREGLGVTGGRLATSGIGGLATQGGLSFLSTREGFICDNVVNFEVVLASGAIVNANARENPDLWVALRGGGNNFGIVTRFDVRTFKQGPMWGGMIFYYLPSFSGQVDALVDELTRPDTSKETHLMLSIGYYGVASSDIVCLNQVYYTQPVKNPPVLAPFTQIQPQREDLNSVRMKTLVQATSEHTGASRNQIRCAYMNVSVKADPATIRTGGDIWCEELQPVKSVARLLSSYTLQPYAVSLLEKSISNGGNSLGLHPTNGPVVNILLLSSWEEQSDDDRVLTFMKRALKRIEGNAASRDQLVPYVYSNYAFSHQDPILSYGEENKGKLQQISRKYDPEGLFQKGCPGGFKLFS
ncbi:FAD-binding domain-containing protein [Whalleya microplaca]|nr:FAD-binding domain-containing protein [Whalleya microplaca]